MGEEDLDRPSSPVKDSSTASPPPSSPPPKSVHRSLGGGQVADALLWKRRDIGIYLLSVSTTLWFLLERGGYSLMTLISNVLLLLVVILFFWAKSASLLNRPLPPIPDLEVSEGFVIKIADDAQVWIKCVLAVGNDIALGRNFKLFIKVACGLFLVSLIGNLFSFFTLVYIGIVLTLTVPALYNKYQDQVDGKLCVVHKVLFPWYRKFDDILSKIPRSRNKEKKTQ